MAYATRFDLEARFNPEEIAMLEQTVGEGGVLMALRDASSEADSYVATRYSLPLPGIPKPLTLATCDIARFLMYKDRPTEEVKYRYEQAISWLKSVASGKATLTFDPALTADQAKKNNDPVTPVAGVYDVGSFSDLSLSAGPFEGRVLFGRFSQP